MQINRLTIPGLAVAALGALIFSQRADSAPPEYSVSVITPSAQVTTIGYDLNDSGQVVGTMGTVGSRATRAFSYTAAGGVVDLGVISGTQSTAYGINAAGQMVPLSAVLDMNRVRDTDRINRYMQKLSAEINGSGMRRSRTTSASGGAVGCERAPIDEAARILGVGCLARLM